MVDGTKLERKELKKGLNNLVKDGVYSYGRNAITDNYVIPFGLFLGAGNELIGLLNSSYSLGGLLSLPLASRIIRKIKSRKKTCIAFSIVNRLLWIFVALIPFLFSGNILWLIFFIGFSSFFFNIHSTSWTSWVMDIVPEKIRGKYFGKRSMYSYAAMLIVTLFVGWFLDKFDGNFGFAVIFLIAVVLGLASTYYLSKIPDIPIVKHKHRFVFSFKHFLRGVKEHKNYSNFVFFMVFVAFVDSLVAPFFIVYLFKNINIAFEQYAIITTLGLIVTILSNKYWGILADRFDDKLIMSACYFAIPVIPLLWIFVASPFSAGLIYIISAFVWAGFNLAAFNYLLDSAPKEESFVFVANYRFLTSVSVSIGPLLGGILATVFGGLTLFNLTGLKMLFLFSSIFFVLFPIWFLDRFDVIRVKRKIKLEKVIIRCYAIYPFLGVLREVEHAIQYLHRIEEKIKKEV